MELKIKRADNGYICEWHEQDNDGFSCIKTAVFEENESDDYGDRECMKNLLWFVSEHFGIIHSKHNKKNLDIKVVDTSEDSD